MGEFPSDKNEAKRRIKGNPIFPEESPNTMKAIKARVLYTGRKVVEEAWLLFQRKKVVGVSRKQRGEVVGEYEVVTPAFIDPHSHIGMVRAGEPAAEEESNEKFDSLTAGTDALDSVQMDDTSFAASVRAGVLYSCVLPGSGNIVGGQSAVLRNYAPTTNAALFARAGIKGAFGYNPISCREWKGKRPYTRMGALGILRAKLAAVRAKLEKLGRLPQKKRGEVEFDTEETVLRALLERQEVFRVHVHKADDVDALLRLADEFKLRVVVEHTMDVHDRRVYETLRKRRIPVVYGPLDSLAYKVELKHESPKNVALLVESGVEYGLMSDHPVILQETLPLTLRWFLRAGLSKQQALEVLTRQNAHLLGLDRLLGTLERGRWASFVGWDGDPFDLACRPRAVYGEGEALFTE